ARTQQLQRHLTLEQAVHRGVHHTHGSAPEAPFDDVAPDALPGTEGVERGTERLQALHLLGAAVGVRRSEQCRRVTDELAALGAVLQVLPRLGPLEAIETSLDDPLDATFAQAVHVSSRPRRARQLPEVGGARSRPAGSAPSA